MTWAGGSFGRHARCVLAPNPGTMTLDGTNTWVLRADDGTPSVVVEGPGGIQNLGTFPSPELITDAIAEVG